MTVLGDTTLGGFARELQAQCTRAALPWAITDGGFDSWEREIFEPSSATRRSSASLAFVLSPRLLEGPACAQLPARVQALLGALEALEPKRTVLFGTVFPDPRRVLPLTAAPGAARLARSVNALLDDFCARNSWFYLVDQASFALEAGIGSLNDARFEALGSLYFSPTGTRKLAAVWARALGAITHTPAKVLVLDLDNTLWGGILGEDGAENLKMGGSGAGFFYRRFQHGLLELKNSGVLLAACSKNNPADAQAVLREHPDCLLRPQDFAALEISWEPKSAGIRRIAEKLRLGLDSFVFVDDSAFERAEVSTALPQVRVLEFPDGPEGLPAMLTQCTFFDRLRITAEDQARSQSYAEEAQREQLRSSAATPADFYRSLQLSARIYRAPPEDFERLHQLIHKTNQFNLTGQRLSQDDLRALLASAKAEVFALRVSDRFGDSGLTGLALVDQADGRHWRVSNFLLSCRIIGRTVENAFVTWLAARAQAAGAESLTFDFAVSPRNQVAAEFLERSGLTPNADRSRWSLATDRSADLPPHYVTISN
ncbi:MAG: HAD-IIIC family phosphatase [Proteobacteria bacterium]|nr:HAD-IIIC family phosphatase [Pseudomonadota bacterium]